MASTSRSRTDPARSCDDAARRWLSERRRGLVLALAVAAAGLLGLWLVEYRLDGLPWQERAYERFASRAVDLSADERAVMAFTSSLASAPVAAATVGVLAVLLWRRLGIRAALFVIACAAVVIPEAALNRVLGPSPDMLAVEPATLANFPSGHVAYATAVFGGLGLLALVRRQPDLAVAAAAIPLLMGPARVVFGVHLASDALAGYALGAAWAILAAFATWGVPRRPAGVPAPRAAGGGPGLTA